MKSGATSATCPTPSANSEWRELQWSYTVLHNDNIQKIRGILISAKRAFREQTA